jgi:CIC family chloride channel protein
MRRVVVTEDGHIRGVLRVNMALRRGLADNERDITVGELTSRKFTVVQESTVAFDVICRIWTKAAIMAIVVRDEAGVPHAQDIVGVITKEHIADSVAENVASYRND